jgi:hypothetical protein
LRQVVSGKTLVPHSLPKKIWCCLGVAVSLVQAECVEISSIEESTALRIEMTDPAGTSLPRLSRPLRGPSVAAALLMSAGMAFADPATISGNAIKEAVTGKTVNLDTPLGTPITITYKDNGTMSGTAGAALSIYLGASSDRGRWWVADGRLCQKFFKWLEGETSCLRIQQNGSRIAWTRDDGKKGTATIMANGPARPQPAYGLGGADLVRAAQQKAPQPAPTTEPIVAAPLVVAPVTIAKPAQRTPAIEPPSPRPIMASLSPVTQVIAPPASVAVMGNTPTTAMVQRLPRDWPLDLSIADQGALLGAMVADSRQGHARHRWCHEIRDIRLLTRPQAVDAEAPELLTAWRHMQSPETSSIPAASCIVPAPALVEVSRQIVDAR